MSSRRNSRTYDSGSDDDDNQGANPNRVRGGKKAAETRRKRGTGFFENNSREQQAELGRRGGSKGGRSSSSNDSRSGSGSGGSREHLNESYEDRRQRGLKAAKTRAERGNDFFKNQSKNGRLSEIGRRGGQKGGRRHFGDESLQDEEEEDGYEPSRSRQSNRYDDNNDYDDNEEYTDDEDDEDDYEVSRQSQSRNNRGRR